MPRPTIHQGLDARYVAGRRYKLVAPFVYESALEGVGVITVPKDFVTNFHSTPRVLWSVFPPDDWAESGVAHDFLYQFARVSAAHGTRAITRRQADQVHRELLILLGAGERRANVMFAGLVIGGWKAWRDYRKTEAVHV